MKPMFSLIVTSVFGIVILSVLGALFKSGHETMLGSTGDPEDGTKVAGVLFGAVMVYAGFLLFCAGQAWLHRRERGVQLQ
ncbi:hypothetical protein C7212DRAFT_351325 [Tuber magnatum]|uniref:Uncharacterized protein n=1 Tax=Tuber magnatum TaxID=42249 RepID=A0A317SY29_9PEZI|nr:hypothetical protein C7212DRAFT_351325 [Tuber magnatum]